MGDERDYNLAILVILLLLCWPAALVYYFTRPFKPSYPYGPPPAYGWNQPSYGATQMINCPQCSKSIPSSSIFCTYCGYKMR